MKHQIKENVEKFGQCCFYQDSLNFFKSLGYESEKKIVLTNPTYKGFLKQFDKTLVINQQQQELTDQWEEVQFLFQLTDEELINSSQLSIFPTNQVNVSESFFKSYIFVAIKLQNNIYTKTQLVNITRQVNKLFIQPVIILFYYDNKLSLAIIDRRMNKKDSDKDVLEKVTLIKDIDISQPHRAHLDILFDLALPNLEVSNFDQLHKKFREVLNTKELNKRFYTDLSNWYFRAQKEVKFPEESGEANVTETSLIRFISRILFTWFLKEKGLIPAEIFTQEFYQREIKQENTPISSRYYKAVLQNLFFATLNTEIKDRGYQVPSTIKGNEQYMIFNKFRYKDYLKNPETYLNYFANIPFLNGGLFDCLDHENENKKRVCIDCFSNNHGFRTKLEFPDSLLFTGETCDFSQILDDNRKNSTQVKGLFEIFNEYKFTIDENTPIDQEIALDPELLGQTLENLLASYNPETHSTARKQTGSFYTPREIVDYMVDESMIAYLTQYLKSHDHSLKEMTALEDVLRDTFAYKEIVHPFNKTEVRHLIDAIFSMKTIDPACGSGAYPMGMLLKMVYVLNRIDPDNKIWKEKLESEIPTEMQNYIKVNTDNYSRKLGLIWNCIYGIDIQSIAIQLTKLRFFISLIAEENVDFTDKKNNFGVLPLPNLETKFICANSLLKIIRPGQLGIWNDITEDIESRVKINRKKYFSANNRFEKKQIEKEDKTLRAELKAALIEGYYSDLEAKKISDWDPYDVLSVAEWFDSEFMFSLSDGFDIVIGNPPYVQLQKMAGTEIQKAYEEQKYASFAKTGDLYCLFYERGNQLLKEEGILCFITSNKWMRAKYGEKLREFFANNTNPLKIIDFGGYKVFESATVDTNIMLFQKKKVNKHYLKACTIGCDYLKKGDINKYFIENTVIINNISMDSLIISSQEEMKIKEKIERIGTPLKDWDVNIYRGILTGFNEAFIISGAKKDELIRQDPKSAEIIRPILRGRDIKRYKAEFADLWLINTHNGIRERNIPPIDILDYPAVKKHLDQYYKILEKRSDKGVTPYNLRNCAYLEEFNRQKIIWGNINYSASFSLIDESSYINAPANLLTSSTVSLEFLIAMMNSALFNYQFKQLGIDLGKAFEWKKQYIEKIFVPIFDIAEISIFKDLYQKYYIHLLDENQFDQSVNLIIYKKVKLLYKEILLINPKINISKEEYNNLTINDIAVL